MDSIKEWIPIVTTAIATILGLFLTRNRDKNDVQNALMDQLQEEIKSKQTIIDSFSVKNDDLQKELQASYSSCVEEKENLKELLLNQHKDEKIALESQVDDVSEELRVSQLECLFLKNIVTDDRIKEAEEFARTVNDINDLAILFAVKDTLDKDSEEDN